MGVEPSAAGVASLPRHHRASQGRDASGAVDPRQLRLRRATRGLSRPALRVRLFLQRRCRRRRGALAVPPSLPAERRACAAAGHDLRVGARGRHGRRSGAAGDGPGALARRLRERCAGSADLAGGCSRVRVHARRAGDDRAIARRGPGGGGSAGGRAVARAGARLELEEVVVNTWTFDPEARRRSYALLAAAFGLIAAPR